MQVTTKVIKKEDRFCIHPHPQSHSVERVLFKLKPLFLVLTFQIYNIPGQGQHGETEHDTTFETCQLIKSKINPSITLWSGQGFIVKWIFHHGLGNLQIYNVQITVKCTCETLLPLPWSDNYSHHVEQPPINLPKKNCPPPPEKHFFGKTSSPYFRGCETPRLIFAEIFQDTIQPTI